MLHLPAYKRLLRLSLIAAAVLGLSACDSLPPAATKPGSKHGARSSSTKNSKAAKKRDEHPASAKTQDAAARAEKNDPEIRGGFR